jgi:hypothetical protein
MGADEEVGKNAGSHTARSAVLLKHLSGQEQRRSRRRRDLDHGVRKHGVEILDSLISNRGLSIDHVVDEHWAAQGSFLKTGERPFRPIGIIGHEIEQNVRVDQIHSVLAACHGHDFVCAQTLSGMAAKAGEPIWPGLPLDLDQDDSAVLASLEIDHAPWTDPQELADPLRDRDLALGL